MLDAVERLPEPGLSARDESVADSRHQGIHAIDRIRHYAKHRVRPTPSKVVMSTRNVHAFNVWRHELQLDIAADHGTAGMEQTFGVVVPHAVFFV